MINISACVLLGSTIFLGGALLSSFKLIKNDISKVRIFHSFSISKIELSCLKVSLVLLFISSCRNFLQIRHLKIIIIIIIIMIIIYEFVYRNNLYKMSDVLECLFYRCVHSVGVSVNEGSFFPLSGLTYSVPSQNAMNWQLT